MYTQSLLKKWPSLGLVALLAALLLFLSPLATRPGPMAPRTGTRPAILIMP
jgi:hypothetical protein